MQGWMKISSRISLLFKSKGTKQRGSPITTVCLLLAAFHFQRELNLVGERKKKKGSACVVCVLCVCCVRVSPDRLREHPISACH